MKVPNVDHVWLKTDSLDIRRVNTRRENRQRTGGQDDNRQRTLPAGCSATPTARRKNVAGIVWLSISAADCVMNRE